MENKITTIITIGLLLSAIFTITPIAVSSSAPAVSVEPSYLKVSSRDTFTVNITIDPAGNEISGAQFDLYFDPTMLNATSQTQGNFLSQDGASTSVIINKINNSIGKIEYGEFRLGAEHGVTECGVLASITFEVIGASGTSDLKLSHVTLSDPNSEIQNVTINHGTIEIEAPSAPFSIYGYISYENGSDCNNPIVTVTNQNTSNKWQAETKSSSNYYQIVLSSGNEINASEILQFHATCPDRSQSNTTNYTVTQQRIDNGGIFDFNITLEAKPVTVFDTGSPENPYPSIMGVHNGTIIPSYNISVNKIYTYPCTGTGGHTEYIEIWNETIGDYAEAHWDGYIGDYHNISFNRTLTLKKGVVYNYTIRTGSYPQIIHATEYPAIGGEIKCKEFIGANGKRYTDWIPAIRLYQ